jgi:murein tripeptide amidase MpaA
MRFLSVVLWGGTLAVTVPVFAQMNPLLPSGAHVQTLCREVPKEATPAEAVCYRTTPSYDETMAYLRKLAAVAPQQVRIEAFGKSGVGRVLDIVIVSKVGVFDPVALHAAKRPIVLVQNSIHAGEMDGKDACLALLRDMVVTKTKASLLERAVFVFIPIYNADGHERRGPYNRINQVGPEEMGWRGNGTNLNLNRDYLKADAPETQAFMAMFHRWLPDFFVDDHVTDGADYQYDVTFTIDDGPNVPRIRRSGLMRLRRRGWRSMSTRMDIWPRRRTSCWLTTAIYRKGLGSMTIRPDFRPVIWFLRIGQGC